MIDHECSKDAVLQQSPINCKVLSQAYATIVDGFIRIIDHILMLNVFFSALHDQLLTIIFHCNRGITCMYYIYKPEFYDRQELPLLQN